YRHLGIGAEDVPTVPFSRARVTVLMAPACGRDQCTARRPVCASTRAMLSRGAPLLYSLPYSLWVKEEQQARPWYRGYPAARQRQPGERMTEGFSPSERPPTARQGGGGAYYGKARWRHAVYGSRRQ